MADNCWAKTLTPALSQREREFVFTRSQTEFGNASSRSSASLPKHNRMLNPPAHPPKQSFGQVGSQTEFGNQGESGARKLRLAAPTIYNNPVARKSHPSRQGNNTRDTLDMPALSDRPATHRTDARFLLRFAATLMSVAGTAGVLAWVLIHVVGATPHPGRVVFPVALFASTALLACGSTAMQRALVAIRRERQRLCRRHLCQAMLAGTLFCGVQSYALYCLIQNQTPATAQADANAFLIVFAGLHAMHFCVAMLFVCYIAVRTFAGRYDHEYYLGITLCTYFWHALGVVWMVILGVFVMALGMQ